MVLQSKIGKQACTSLHGEQVKQSCPGKPPFGLLMCRRAPQKRNTEAKWNNFVLPQTPADSQIPQKDFSSKVGIYSSRGCIWGLTRQWIRWFNYNIGIINISVSFCISNSEPLYGWEYPELFHINDLCAKWSVKISKHTPKKPQTNSTGM